MSGGRNWHLSCLQVAAPRPGDRERKLRSPRKLLCRRSRRDARDHLAQPSPLRRLSFSRAEFLHRPETQYGAGRRSRSRRRDDRDRGAKAWPHPERGEAAVPNSSRDDVASVDVPGRSCKFSNGQDNLIRQELGFGLPTRHWRIGVFDLHSYPDLQSGHF